jgi:diguanylate cyclase (GGDEF)-like protein
VEAPLNQSRVLPDVLRAQSLELLEPVIAGTRDGVIVLDAAGKLLLWNAAAATITGWSYTEAAARNLSELARTSSALTQIREGKWVELRQVAIETAGAAFTLVLFTDSTPHLRLRDTREQFRALGLIDHTTNLSGRQLAMVHIEHAIALAKRDKRSVGLLALKLDRFRELRADAERDSVDETLRQFAKRLSTFVRASDVPARLAEDTFLVVLSAMTSSNDAVVVAVRLLLAMAEPFDVIGHLRSLHCSIGVAEAPRDAEEAAALLGAALGAADRAQVQGGGRYALAGADER